MCIRDSQMVVQGLTFILATFVVFSAIAWAPGAERYLEDCISIFEEYGWDWTYHAFREWTGWSVEHGGVFENQFPVENSPRKQVLKKYFERNRE